MEVMTSVAVVVVRAGAVGESPPQLGAMAMMASVVTTARALRRIIM
jgi:hypothetical protein